MADPKTLDILKEAILLEKRGRAFYLKVAEETKTPEVRDFFRTMADEELRHVEMLSDHARAFVADHRFETKAMDQETGAPASLVLNAEVKRRVTAAGFEAAAISAAMLMEEKAVSLYAAHAESAAAPEEKALYSWLASWERDHLKALQEIDRALKESIWNDNDFWPF